METQESLISQKYKILKPLLDERTKRIWAATEAKALGYGGVTTIAKAIGMAPNTIKKGLAEISEPISSKPNKIRKAGGGRKLSGETQPGLLKALENLIEPLAKGTTDPALRWTCKSTRKLSEELKKLGYSASNWLVHKLLSDLGYNLKNNQKSLENSQYSLRNIQFNHINSWVLKMIEAGNPVLSVDFAKNEILDNFANRVNECESKNKNAKVNSLDCFDPSLEPANPYEIKVKNNNPNYVNIDTNHDIAAFAIASISSWWYETGHKLYQESSAILIAVGGRFNSNHSKLWKRNIKLLSEEIGKPVFVCHFPPGTSKWNKVEQHLFSFTSLNWKNIAFPDYKTTVSLIGANSTLNGLDLKPVSNTDPYKVDLKVNTENCKNFDIIRNSFQGDWNYKILPKSKSA